MKRRLDFHIPIATVTLFLASSLAVWADEPVRLPPAGAVGRSASPPAGLRVVRLPPREQDLRSHRAAALATPAPRRLSDALAAEAHEANGDGILLAPPDRDADTAPGAGDCLADPPSIAVSPADIPAAVPQGNAFDDSAWWRPHVTSSLQDDRLGVTVDVSGLVLGTLRFAPQVMAINAEPGIRQTRVVEELAEFDWRATMESSWADVNEPVGNTLTTGTGDDRFRDQTWGESIGLRRQVAWGGDLEAVQRLGWQTNNSRFLIPPRQGTTRLELNYTQPLLNSAGRAVNQSQIVLAQLDVAAASDTALQELQDHLLRVTSAYWELYRVRAILLQRRRAVDAAASLVASLQARREIDAAERQLLRATAAEARRKTAVIRAANDVRNAESRLRMLVGDPALASNPYPELLPVEHPLPAPRDIELGDAAATALAHRPDIQRSARRVRAAEVQLDVAKNAELPRLDLIMAGYTAGLRGQSDFLGAYGDQFATGRPSYSLGVLFEVPLGNRRAHAVRSRRESEWFKAVQELRVTVQEGVHDVEVAHAEVETTAREAESTYQAMIAAVREVEFLLDRWQTLAGLNRSAADVLEELIDAQDRLADEEGAFVTAEVRHVLAVAELRRAMGTLVAPSAVRPSTGESGLGDVAPSSHCADPGYSRARRMAR